MSLSALREALAANLDTIPDVQVSAYVMANPTPPMIQVLPAGIGYDRTMGRGHDDVTLTVQAIVALTLDVGSQKLLDRLCENAAPYSVKAAIEADKTLGGACQDLHVTDASGLQVVEVQTGGARLVVEWTVLILAGGLV